MKKIFFYTILLTFLFSFKANSQEFSNKAFITEIHEIYSKNLSLSNDQASKFKVILQKYNKQLEQVLKSNSENKNNEFNKISKLQSLEVYKILSKQQFELYKVTKAKIEPFKKYKL